MDQVIVLVLVVVVVEVLEMVLAAQVPVMIPLEILFVKVTTQLERGLTGFYYLLTDHVSLDILLLTFLLVRVRVTLTYNSLVW